ncbi:MAG: PAS domain-containing protein [Desulfosarcinaceae bacterium]|nr:PAS domain-containing protein [Desulfosarcinaceae bacterium]
MRKPPLLNAPHLRSLIDAFPSPMFIVDEDLVIHDANRSSLALFENDLEESLDRLCGDSLKCVHAQTFPKGCGATPWCPQCVIRQSTKAVLSGETAFKQVTSMTLMRDGHPKDLNFLVTGAPFPYADRQYILLTFEDITELSTLRKIIPICSFCRKVRDDKNYWQQVEAYLEKYADIRFSHGLCPECIEKHYADDI